MTGSLRRARLAVASRELAIVSGSLGSRFVQIQISTRHGHLSDASQEQDLGQGGEAAEDFRSAHGHRDHHRFDRFGNRRGSMPKSRPSTSTISWRTINRTT